MKPIKVILIAAILLCCFPAFASNMFVGIGNDTWNNGLSENFDDQLSFRILSEIFFNDFNININSNAYTNRGWKDSQDSDFYNGRLDVFNASVGYTFNLTDNIQIRPEAGISVSGNLGMQAAQNLVHEFMDLNYVELNYDSFFETHLITNLSLIYHKNLVTYEKSALRFSTAFTTGNRFGFDYTQSFNFSLGIRRNKKSFDTLYASLGLQNVLSVTDSNTIRLSNEYFKGVVLKFGFNSALVSLDYSFYPSMGYGITNIKSDLLSFKTLSKILPNNCWIQLGKCQLFNRDYFENKIGLNVGKKLALVYTNRYTSGFPILNENETDTSIRYKRNYTFNFVGIRLNHPIKPLVCAYTEASVGVSSWKLEYLYNMDQDAVTMSEDTKTQRYWAFDTQVGFSLLPEKPYGINVFAGSVMIHDKGNLASLFTQDNTNQVKKDLNFYAGMGIKIHLDL